MDLNKKLSHKPVETDRCPALSVQHRATIRERPVRSSATASGGRSPVSLSRRLLEMVNTSSEALFVDAGNMLLERAIPTDVG